MYLIYTSIEMECSEILIQNIAKRPYKEKSFENIQVRERKVSFLSKVLPNLGGQFKQDLNVQYFRV